MSIRNPHIDPMPGDIFQSGTGTIRTVIDRFVSTGTKPGSENPGYFVEEKSADGSLTKTVTNSQGVFRSKVKKAAILNQDNASAQEWQDVPRYPHNEVTAIMRRKHRRED
jgi:hypothetical protein